MIKYFWYVDADPDKLIRFRSSNIYVKRSPSTPPNNYTYIVESIDGFKHSIKTSDNKPLFTINDNGNVDEINKINTMIENKILELTSEIISKKHEKMNENQMSNRMLFDQGSLYSSPEMSMINSLRRKKRIKSRLNRNPIKKKVIKKISK